MTTLEEFNCLFCKESFENKEELQIHFRKHGDPKFNQSIKGGKADMASCGEKTEEGENVRCDVCEEVFPTISKAITHKHKVHPDHDAKYFCPWCGKLFTMKHLYNKHIQSVHESKEESTGDSGFHCDYCDADFFLPSAMVYHNKYFHRQDTELADIGHSRKLKMFTQETLPIYYCPFCGEEYCNKVNLHKHMGDDHIDENQRPEDVMRCPLCDAVFYHLDAYELHLTFHSTDDLYADDNEMAKEITEFSLEAVPPLLEKVENESYEDEPSQSMGIEELLQQAMNESNGDSVREKKKKHKKHKKSKNAAITLDEFLTMNTDLFGEGLDVQGIVEVPTQVVAKSLKQKLPRAKPGPKPLPSELQKLKKAGLVIKKNKPNTLQGMKVITKKPTIRPGLKISHESDKIKTAIKKPDTATSSNDALSKLLNQSNNQIKIVKKSAKADTSTEVLAKEIGLPKSEDTESNYKHNQALHDEISEVSSSTNNKQNVEHSIDSDNKNDSESFDDMLDFTNKEVTTSTKINEKMRECIDDDYTTLGSQNQNQQTQVSVEDKEKNSEKSKDNMNTLNALRNISQHITIKSLSSQNTDVKVENQKPDDKLFSCERENKDVSEISAAKNKDCSSNAQKQFDEKKTLNPLQHLSHLTVKPANKSSNIAASDTKSGMDDRNDSDNEMETDNFGDDNDSEETNYTQKESMTMSKKVNADIQNQSSKLDALKNLSKHITVKSLSQSPNSPKKLLEKEMQDESGDKQHNETQTTQADNIILSNKPITKASPITKNSSSPNCSPKIANRTQTGDINKPINELANKNEHASQILKQFPNITSKPFSTQKTMTQTKIQTVNQSANVKSNQKGNFVQSSVKKVETKQEEMEVFNIDDSDDEEMFPSQDESKSSNIKPDPSKAMASKHVEETKANTMSEQVLKNLSKHITIKSSYPPKTQKSLSDHDEEFDGEDLCSDLNEQYDNLKDKEPEQKNTLLQKKLKNLSNLTIKSNNTSPKLTSPVSKPNITDHSEEYNSDCSNTSNKVKITELPDNYTSDDDDVPLQEMKTGTKLQNNDTDIDLPDYEEEDIENKIIPTKLFKPTKESCNNPSYLNNLKNISVKSSKEDDDQSCESEGDDKVLVPYQNKNLSIKRLRQTPFPEDEHQTFPQTSSKQNVGRTVNQNMSQSSNQVNTINKEVTVQKFQSKTVVQEITTTVTKTIRTINQTVKQEVRNASQSQSSMPVTPQKIQGMKPQCKNFISISVRAKAPTMGPRARTSVTPTHTPASTNIRPSNQLVPARPGLNLARPSNPRMQVARRMPLPPSTNTTHSPVIGKPLRISPNAVLPTSKRQQNKTEEFNGPFSCFKKPKESLFPTGEEGNSTVNVSSSQMTQSNFTSTTKIMKGNSVVTSTKTKSQMAASSEQLSRLNSLSGLKVVKNSQAKQTSKVEERTDISPAKRTALEAIEKLQKQGLLVKKPKVDEPTIEEPDSDNDRSNPEDVDDDYYDT